MDGAKSITDTADKPKACVVDRRTGREKVLLRRGMNLFGNENPGGSRIIDM